MSKSQDFNNLIDEFNSLQRKFDLLNKWVFHKYAGDPEMLALQKVLNLDSIEFDHGTMDPAKIDADVHANKIIKIEENQMTLSETIHIIKPCVVKLEKLIINKRSPDKVVTINTKPNYEETHTISLTKQKGKHKCHECGKIFRNPTELGIHQRIHTGEKPFNCDICSKSFRQIQHLKLHKNTHEDLEIPLYQCIVCNKRFTTFAYLKVHKRSHTGEKPFECNVCKKRFAGQSQRNNHSRVHRDTGAYNCKFCEKNFRWKQTFKNHLLTHTGEKPFGCLTCNVYFCKRSKLNAHNQIHSVTP